MTTTASPLLHALERASILATEGGATVRDEPSVAGTSDYLMNVSTQVAQVQTWLHQHPEMLRVLDAGIRQEVRQMERRVNLVNVVTNLGFTILGTILGLLLPLIISHFH